MRKEITYFNGGWYAMLLGYITQRFLRVFVQNPILNFLLTVAVFMVFYFATLKICEKILKCSKLKKKSTDDDKSKFDKEE